MNNYFQGSFSLKAILHMSKILRLKSFKVDDGRSKITLFCLQSCIGILATLILTFYLLKRQDAKLWRQLKSVLSVFRQVCVLCRIFNLSGARLRRMMGMRRNRVGTQAGDVPLETIQGKVLKN